MVFLLLSDPPGRPRPSLSAPNVWRVVPPPCSDSGVSAVALPKARPLQQQASHATAEGGGKGGGGSVRENGKYWMKLRGLETGDWLTDWVVLMLTGSVDWSELLGGCLPVLLSCDAPRHGSLALSLSVRAE